MNKKQFFTVLLFYMSYLFFGATVYYLIEPQLEIKRHHQNIRQKKILSDLLHKFLAPNNKTIQKDLFVKLELFCKKSVIYTEKDLDYQYLWTFYHSLFFMLTIVTTVGYGNLTPMTTFGRYFLMFYAILGLPMNAIIFGQLGKIFGRFFLGMYDRFVEANLISRKRYIEWRLNVFGQFFVFLAPGMILFIFLPALVFTYAEKWDYESSVYYAFVSLTTIGFGDYAATFQNRSDNELISTSYDVFVFFWFILGLGYVIMITESLVRMYQRTKVSRLGFKYTISAKKQKLILRHGFHKDLAAIIKFFTTCRRNTKEKVTKHTEHNSLKRTQSCPDLNCNNKKEKHKHKPHPKTYEITVKK